ncbi:hypothetical protein C8R45DRAFT_1079678 [Mycena sanguinolenta]|nr:hypothetical protein C8R45DRAFT_1079678 [Mycena sanguinolenta]
MSWADSLLENATNAHPVYATDARADDTDYGLAVQVDSSRLESTSEPILESKSLESTWKSIRVAVLTRLDSTQVGCDFDFEMTWSRSRGNTTRHYSSVVQEYPDRKRLPANSIGRMARKRSPHPTVSLDECDKLAACEFYPTLPSLSPRGCVFKDEDSSLLETTSCKPDSYVAGPAKSQAAHSYSPTDRSGKTKQSATLVGDDVQENKTTEPGARSKADDAINV